MPVAFNYFSDDSSIVSAEWYNDSWNYKKKITINGSLINHTVANFPFLVYNSSDTDLATYAQADGGDIIFVDSTETTKFAHDLDYYSNGKYSAWVNLSLTAGVEYTFYMYYGNSGCANQENPSGTWDSNYLAVYHFSDTGSTLTDSTSNGNDGTVYGTPVRSASTQNMGYRWQFDGSTEYVQLPAGCQLRGEGTVESVVSELSTASGVIFRQTDATSENSITTQADTNKWHFHSYANGSLIALQNFIVANTDLLYNALSIKTNNKMVCKINNTQTIDGVSSQTPDVAYWNITVGRTPNTDSGHLEGYLDELRISKTERSNGWLNMTHSTMFLDLLNFSTENTNLILPTSPSPTDGKTNVLITGQNTSILVNASRGGTFNLTWYWLASGEWKVYGKNLSVTNGTYQQDNSNFSAYSTTYQWAINASNATVYNNKSYSFTTRAALENPTAIDGTVYGGTNINITWTEATYISNTTLVYKANSYPTSPTDGTELYNGTNEYYNHTSYLNTNYYALFSYNASDNIFSSGADVAWGDLNVSVYNESDGTAITNWDIFITNPSSEQTYNSTGNSNYLLVDADDFPTGDDTIIIISKEHYRDGVYIMDVDERTRYTLDAYLSSKNNSFLYAITVVGYQEEFTSPPVEDVKVDFEKYVSGGEYEYIGRFITDANGQFNIYLIPGTYYKVTLSKPGYDTKLEYFYPNEDDRTQEFRITPTEVEEVVYDLFDVNITFTATMDDPGYLLDSNVTVTYADVNLSTTNTDIYIYDWYNGTYDQQKGSDSNTSNSFTVIFDNLNNTRSYLVVMYFNNTANFDVSSPVTIIVGYKHPYSADRVKFDIDERVNPILGPFMIGDLDVGWASAISVILAFICLVSFGVYNSGFGLIAAAMSLGLTQGIYGLWATNALNPLLIALIPFLIVLGIILMMSKGNPGDRT